MARRNTSTSQPAGGEDEEAVGAAIETGLDGAIGDIARAGVGDAGDGEFVG